MTDDLHHRRSGAERDDDILTRAVALGITPDVVDELVEAFYARVQSHPRLGPIFHRHAGEDWPGHLATMKSFWRSVALGTREYQGRPVPAHLKIGIDDPALFAEWLALFKAVLQDVAPCQSAEAFFLGRAANIARSLQYAIFGLPSLSPVAR